MTRPTWTPIITGDTAVAVTRVVREIAAELVALDLDRDGVDISLAGGVAGIAVALAEVDDAGVVPGARVHGERLIDRALQELRSRPMPSIGLYSGLSGVTWALGRVTGAAPGADTLDELIADALDRPHRGPYDLVSGLIGVGVYALDRLPRRPARRILARVVERLDLLAVARGAGIAWYTPPELLFGAKLAAFPRGMFDVGLAHGAAGAIALLAEIHAAGIERARCRRLIDGAVRWLLAAAPPGGGPCRYPLGIADDITGPPSPTRPGWCYGTTSVAAAVLAAGVRLEVAAWRDAGHALAAEAAGHDTIVGDAGLCHGAAGLAHLYNRFFHATGDARFAHAARRWVERCLAIRQLGVAVAGFPRLDGPEGPWEPDPGVLTGAAGVALALTAAVTARAPRWDDALLASLGSATRATAAGTRLASSRRSQIKEVNR